MKHLFAGFFGPSLYLLVLIGCSSPQSNNANDEEFEQAKEELKENVTTVLNEIPSPSEIPFLLEATGADFNPSLLNEVDKVDAYIGALEDKVALNLGIYSTDIGYLSSYNQTQEALLYLEASKKLAEKLNIADALGQNQLKRFEAQIENRDSLATIVNNTVDQAETLLKKDNRASLAALLITGSFVEGLFISTQIVDTYPKNLLPDDARNQVLSPLIRTILDQEKPTADLVELMMGVEQTSTVTKVLNELEGIKASYGDLNIEEEISNNRGDLVLNDETLRDITERVAQLRLFITQ